MLKKHLQLLLATLLLITTMVYAQNPAPSMYLDKLIDKAEQGDVKAQYDLGFRFEMGIDVDKNYEKALYWYKKAAEQGLASAQYSLGYLYEEGLGVAQSYEKAHEWYVKANEQGSAEAKSAIGVLYYNGKGVKQSYQAAKKWFGQACDAGEKESCEQYHHLSAIGI